MNYNKHSDLIGKHAFLSPSQYHWLNYDNEKLIENFNAKMAAEQGTRIHEWAAETIRLGYKQPKSNKTINAYINDAIGFRLIPEQPLQYSQLCFGTADTISNINHIIKQKFVRIHDLKTGKIPAHMEQLLTYAALLCLEYNFKPGELDWELRIYQNDDINIFNPTANDILPVMDAIVSKDKVLKRFLLTEEI